MTFLDRAIAYISPQRALRRELARRQLELSGYYRGADSHRIFADWLTSGNTSQTPPAYELTTLRARSRDLNRNDPIAAGATDTIGVNVVGSGLKPQSKLRADRLGITEIQADDLRRQAEDIFSSWVRYADAANRLSFDEIQFLAMRKVIEDGEIFCLPTWAPEPWRPIGRCLELVESDRVDSQDNAYSYGIKLGQRGQPVAYSFAQTDYSKSYQTGTKYSTVPATDSKGRPMVLHVFPSRRAGQIRGIPFFAPAMSYFKHMADYLEAEVVSSRVAACLSIFVTQADPYSGMVINQSGTESSTNARIQSIEPGLVQYLGVGESINVVDPKRPGDAFAPFVEGVLRIIGVSLGMPYELLLKDFSKTNYSSARASLLEGRRHFTNWRSWFSTKFCQPVWELVLEEAFLRGLFQARDFYRYREEYCRAQWIGAGWGWVDPVKETDAAISRINFGLSTYADEISSVSGADWEETLDQRKREQDRIADLGVTIANAGNGGGTGQQEQITE